MPIVPTLPPSPTGKRKRSQEDHGEDSSSDDVGPQLPPGRAADTSKSSESKKARVLGPSLPSSLQQNGPKSTSDAESDSEEDDFGPALPGKDDPVTVKTSVEQPQPVSHTATAPTVRRDEWMTMEPTSGDWSQKVDPTKIKSRKFNTGRSAPAASSGRNSWHETPEQKQTRLRNEMLGIKDKSKRSEAKPSPTPKSEDDIETAERMKEYNKARGPSLMDAHSTKQKVEKEDDPSARAFDREKDIAGGLINATQRREMMKKSSDFNSRFSTAKYL